MISERAGTTRTASAMTCHDWKNRKVNVPIRSRTLPAMSESEAMTKVSTCSMSLVTRRSMSPVRRRLWKARERRCRCEYSVTRMA